MIVHLLLVLASVVLSSPFGTAEATAIADDDGLTVEMSVAVSGTVSVVIVRPFSSFEQLPPTALVDRGDGTWGGLVVLPSAEDWSIVFDAIDPDGEAFRSDTTSLTALGVDPVVVAGPPDAPVPSRGVDASTLWLIAGVLLAAGALAALAWWTFAGTGDGGDEAANDTDTIATSDEEPGQGSQKPPDRGAP
ncbi:MAG TPA: hypothetical protein VLA29_00890 [Acidimicrobiia bacterium]|nr:hypothetical protein [Acidimicrobiia bacterium]